MKTTITLICSVIVQIAASSYGADLVFFGNLHSHTSYSDGSGTPKQAYTYARDKAKLDFLAVTEHNHKLAESSAGDRKDGKLIATNPSLYTGPQSSAVIPAARTSTSSTFVALYGQELSSISSGNHVNIFDVDEVISESDVPNGRFDRLLDWLATRPDSTGQKPVVQFNHADLFDNYAKEYGADDFGSQTNWIAKMGEYVSLFEMLNGPAMTKTAGNRAAEVMDDEFDHYLLLGFRFAPTGDQDNHYKTWGTATDARTAIITDELTKPKLLAAMRARHAYATEDKNLKLIFKVNGRLCGDVITAPTVGDELQISYTIDDANEPDASYRFQVFSGSVGGTAVNEINAVSASGNNSAPREIQDVRYSGSSQFVYFKITQANEDGPADRSWTAPVWFTSTGSSSVIAATLGAANESDYVASKRSSIYHVSAECRSAKMIKPENLVTGAQAKEGRTIHNSCPVQ
jgi:hypothetical protein